MSEKLISLSETLKLSSIIITKEIPKTITSDSNSIFIPNQHYTNLRFRSYNSNNLFEAVIN